MFRSGRRWADEDYLIADRISKGLELRATFADLRRSS